MTKMYDVIYPRNFKTRDGEQRTDWLRIGRAFDGQKGIDILLYSMPVGAGNENGEVRIQLRESDPNYQPDQRKQRGA